MLYDERIERMHGDEDEVLSRTKTESSKVFFHIEPKMATVAMTSSGAGK